jgi:hypothetical protein
MVWYHDFSNEEVAATTGLTTETIESAKRRLQIVRANKPKRPADAPLLVLPYPGGRHPRIGFLDGAIHPQRETKVSVFTPWDPNSYVVVDVPEAIWSNLGLTYLAHTHIPTIWDEQGIQLEPLEWQHADQAKSERGRRESGELRCERTLPNGIVFGSRVVPEEDSVRMSMWLTNGTPHTLTDLRVQNCVMLKGAAGFAPQTNDNKVMRGPYIACHSPDRKRWIITAWLPLQRTWGNEDCPCMHSDPQFPDCEPGQTQRIHGWLSFYEGTDIQRELGRIERTGWHREMRSQGQ